MLGLLLLVVLLLPGLLELAGNWLWFQEIGYVPVYRTSLVTRLLLFLGVGTLTFVVIYANLRLGQRGLVPDPVVVRFAPAARRVDVTALLRRLSLPVAAALAFLFALGAMQLWPQVVVALHRMPFGVADPVFGRDVGFYVFTLPVLEAALGLLTGLVVLSLMLAVPVYWLRGDVILAPRHLRVEPSAQLHLGALLVAFFLLAAARAWWVTSSALLHSTTGPLVGASYTDLAVHLPALRVQAVTALVAAAVVVYGAVRRTLAWHAAQAVLVYVLVVVVGTGVLPALVQRLRVAPNELTLETPQIRDHIAFTRRAWGLDAVATRELSGEATLTAADVAANGATIENVRLWDREPLLQTFGQLQAIRTYYDFEAVDDDRYWIGGRYRQVLLSPRELNADALPTQTFINRHLTFTHGMGLTLAPVNEVRGEGLPVLFIKDLPPVSTVGLPVTRPQLYYGELTDDWVVVRTRQPEFDYPAGDENVFAAYEGRGGVPVSSFARRLLLATRFGSLNFLLSGDIGADSRVLFRRDVEERAQAALPFLRFDDDPYLVVDSAGTLQWMLDAYTTSARYPYARPLRDGTSYMRNSVKVVIDAYHGTVRAYVADPRDPIARAWADAFPQQLRPLAEMPSSLRAHLRYPEDLYRAQVDMYRVYHMAEPDMFYHREDEWQIPQVDEPGERTDLFMRHIIMRLPEERAAEYIFMTPFTPRQKDNLAAWMVARNDGEHYGELIVYRFPKQSLVFGPRQVVNRINQDTEIARQLTLWDQRGSTVIRGELLVIPIEESLIYVQPIYLRAEGGRIPELKRVVVAYQNQVAMAETLDGALALLFGDEAAAASGAPAEGGAAPPAAPSAPPAAGTTGSPGTGGAARDALAAEALRHYERAVQAQRAGDWATYGTELERLGEVLRRLRGGAAAAGAPPTAPAVGSPPPR
ncbi:MAG TPA: UPF0182 family protein [Gemmatimonadaceae bacterium]|nr:UPF0182 family protein [Gemmatimonadaceae bacterium]